jgi:hypothetical protein
VTLLNIIVDTGDATLLVMDTGGVTSGGGGGGGDAIMSVRASRIMMGAEGSLRRRDDVPYLCVCVCVCAIVFMGM